MFLAPAMLTLPSPYDNLIMLTLPSPYDNLIMLTFPLTIQLSAKFATILTCKGQSVLESNRF